jgi:hypothetical protein
MRKNYCDETRSQKHKNKCISNTIVMVWMLKKIPQRPMCWRSGTNLWHSWEVMELLGDESRERKVGYRGHALDGDIGTSTISFLCLFPGYHEVSRFLHPGTPHLTTGPKATGSCPWAETSQTMGQNKLSFSQLFYHCKDKLTKIDNTLHDPQLVFEKVLDY